MTLLERTQKNKQLIYEFISENEGCTKVTMMEAFGLSKNQLNNCLNSLKGEIHLLLIGSQRHRIGTYYLADGEQPHHYQTKPTIDGARIIHAGDILAKKYGYKSPDLRKKEYKGVGSAMENDG
jgi:hypothetical protein